MNMTDKHLSSQFDAELTSVSTRVMELGGMVEAQLATAMSALSQMNASAAEQVLAIEEKVNRAEVDIDRELSAIIAKRQPTARDLRLLVAISKATANLERAGDEAARIARLTRNLIEDGSRMSIGYSDLRVESDLALRLLRKALDSFARLDVMAAASILREDDQIDHEFDGFMRKLATHMMEDPRTISQCIDLIFVAKAVERIGDHAKNLAELTIYVVSGADVRHATPEEVASVIN
jgi:phosphate transport system protein